MSRLAVALALVTIATLNVILVAGSGFPNEPLGDRRVAVAVPVMDLCLVLSSALLGRVLLARGFRALGILFLLNLVIFAAAFVVRVGGAVPPRWLLFGTDVYWLNLYLIGISKHWRTLLDRSAVR